MAKNREHYQTEAEQEAQASLDQMRVQSGGALSGRELLERMGRAVEDHRDETPPLDWRLTPRNVILQVLALAAFIGVIWFLIALVSDSVGMLFNV